MWKCGSGALVTHLDKRLEAVVLDAHVLDRVKKGDALREPLLDLTDGLEDGFATFEWAEVFREEDADVAERADGREKDGDDERLALLPGHGREDARASRAAFLGDDGSDGAIQDDVDDVLGLRALIQGHGRGVLALSKTETCTRQPRDTANRQGSRSAHLGSLTLGKVDDDTPTKVHTVMLDRDEPTGLQERKTVRRVGDDVLEIASEVLELLLAVVVLGDDLLVRDDDFSSLGLSGAKLCAKKARKKQGSIVGTGIARVTHRAHPPRA